jgi:hypothetical protein
MVRGLLMFSGPDDRGSQDFERRAKGQSFLSLLDLFFLLEASTSTTLSTTAIVGLYEDM